MLAEKPDTLKAYYDKTETINNDDALPSLTKEFVAIRAASAIGAENCLLTPLKVVKKFGAKQEQLLLAILMKVLLTGTDALSKSLRAYEDFKEQT